MSRDVTQPMSLKRTETGDLIHKKQYKRLLMEMVSRTVPATWPHKHVDQTLNPVAKETVLTRLVEDTGNVTFHFTVPLNPNGS